MKKRLLITVFISVALMTGCTSTKNNKSSTVQENETGVIIQTEEVTFSNKSNPEDDIYSLKYLESNLMFDIDMLHKSKSSIIDGNGNSYKNYGRGYRFIYNQNQFVHFEDGEYIELPQEHRKLDVMINNRDDLNYHVEYYVCKAGDEYLIAPDLDNMDLNSEIWVSFAQCDATGEHYIVLLKNQTHEGPSWQYPLKFDVKLNEYTDFFVDKNIDDILNKSDDKNEKKVYEYEYLTKWYITESGCTVDYSEEFTQPESQTWKRGKVAKY